MIGPDEASHSQDDAAPTNGDGESTVALVSISHDILEQLVQAAIGDAAADDVTPPLTPEGTWTRRRIAWLRQFHRDRAQGLDGPRGEATWAVLLNAEVVGSIRLKRTECQGSLEVGIWLTRGARGQGVGHRAMIAALNQASTLGASRVIADTTADNTAAITLLRRLGFDLTMNARPDSPAAVVAVMDRSG